MKHEKKLVGSIQPEMDALHGLIVLSEAKIDAADKSVESEISRLKEIKESIIKNAKADILTYTGRIEELGRLKELNKGAKDDDLCEI